MYAIISYTISAILLPFKAISILILTPLHRFIQIFIHGVFILPFQIITSTVNVVLMPFTYFKPSFNLDYSLWNLLRDLEVVYQFIICSVLFGLVIGITIGGLLLTINYLLSFKNYKWVVFGSPVSISSWLFSRRGAGIRDDDQTVLMGNETDIPDFKFDDNDDHRPHDSIYEDDDGYGLDLTETETEIGSRSKNTTFTQNDTVDSGSVFSRGYNNNLTASTSLTSLTGSITEEGSRMLRYRNSIRRGKNDTDTETESSTETETEDDQFFDSPNRLIHTITEE